MYAKTLDPNTNTSFQPFINLSGRAGKAHSSVRWPDTRLVAWLLLSLDQLTVTIL
jgi:hypothetical protein